MAPVRGRGRGRGSPCINPRHSTQSPIDPSLLDPLLHSSGPSSTNGPSVDAGQSAYDTQSPGSNDQPNVAPTSDDPPLTSGPSSSDSQNEVVDRRLVISVQQVNQPRRFVPDSVTRDITSEMLMRMPNPADTWRSYSPDMKELLFTNFMEKYRFASDYDRNMARTVWDRTCTDRLSDCLAKARKKAKEMAKSDNIVDLKGHGPKGIRSEIWDGLVDIWITQQWQKKSIAGKNNRASKPDLMVHTAGSRSFGQHLKAMEEEYKRPISYCELYNKTHKRKDGQYISNKAKDFVESYENAITEKYGEDKSKHPTVDSDIWIQMAGENKKGRIHGIGHSLDLSIAGGSSSSVAGPSTVAGHRGESQTVLFTQVSEVKESQTVLFTQVSEVKESQLQLQATLQAHMETQVKAQEAMQAQMETQVKAQEAMQAQIKTQTEMQALIQAQLKAQADMMMQFFQNTLKPTPPSDQG